MGMPLSMLNAVKVHLHVQRWLHENPSATYHEAMQEMERAFPGWFVQDGDPMIVEYILLQTGAST